SFCFSTSRRRHTRFSRDWSSDVCSSDLDGITCRVSNVWHLYKKGVWEYSIFVKHIASDFYTSEELKRKFATLLPEYKPKTISLRSEERRVGKECRYWWTAYI